MAVRFVTHKEKKELEDSLAGKVSFKERQSLTEAQKALARENMGVPSKEETVKEVLTSLETWKGGDY